tara:strand:+ start:779 stop:2272 length:1494 start_codon:yes stop_codon:yes gene_type:complete
MPRKSKSRIQNVGNVSTVWNQQEFLGKFQAWHSTWNQGERWGIIGAQGRPKTVVLELKEHGRAKWARSPPESIEYGFGNLLLEVDNLVKSETILETDMEHLETIIKNMELILNKPHLNPQNIRFSNVVTRFKAPKREGDEPIVKRTTPWYGHYRTPAFVKYMKWKKDQGLVEAGTAIPEAQSDWGSKSENKANPPMYQAVTTLLDIAKDALVAPKTLPEGEPLKLYISNLHKGSDGGLHQITSIQTFIKEILQDASIYPAGKSRSRKIILMRLREKIQAKEFEVTADEAKFLSFIDGFGKILGTENGLTIQLDFPQSAGALRSLIRDIPGLDLSTITRPRAANTPPEIEFKPGIELKMLNLAKTLKDASDSLQILKSNRKGGYKKSKYSFASFKQSVIEYVDGLEEGSILSNLQEPDSTYYFHYVAILDLYNKIESKNSGLTELQVAQQTRYKQLYRVIGKILRNDVNFDDYHFSYLRNTKNNLYEYTKVMGEREDE